MMTRREANARRLLRGFEEIATSLTKHGVPHPSERWMVDVERFYTHATATAWIACVGRGGGKNLIGLLCDLTELLFGRFTIPAGERHYAVHVSENRTEAEKTLRQVLALRVVDRFGLRIAPAA